MDLLHWLDARGGVAHRSDVVAAGYGRRAQRQAQTLGRWWLATPGADPQLALAAAHNVRIACVSAAERRGLAVLSPPDVLHAAVSAASGRPAVPALRLHRTRVLVPVPRTALVESVADMLSHVATCLPRIDALVVWESALRRGEITQAAVAALPWAHLRARELAAVAGSRSDSVLETVLADGLRRRGIAFRQQVPIGGHRVDFLIGSRLVVQTDGYAYHSAAADRRRDIEHDARLLIEGVRVLRFDAVHVLRRLERTLDAVEAAALLTETRVAGRR